MDSVSVSIARGFFSILASLSGTLSYVSPRVNAWLLDTRLDTRLRDATGTWLLSEVCVATPVLSSGRRCSRPAGREEPALRNGQIGLAAGRWDKKRAEGEGQNGGRRKST